jgi:hypothetical protein
MFKETYESSLATLAAPATPVEPAIAKVSASAHLQHLYKWLDGKLSSPEMYQHDKLVADIFEDFASK